MIYVPLILFAALIAALVALDLGVFNRREHTFTVAEALTWSAFWISLALAFTIVVFFLYGNGWMGFGELLGYELTGRQAAIQFLTAFLIEKALSLDNVFVIALIFSHFQVPLVHQHRVLFWGILGALAARAVFIAAGVTLFHFFDWIVYLFGLFIWLSAAHLFIIRREKLDPDENAAVMVCRKTLRLTDRLEGNRFTLVRDGKRWFTPLFLALVMVETMDVFYAVDSIPAVLSVTHDPFIAFTSNAFAVFGMRSMYFALVGLLFHYRYIKMSLVAILVYVGFAMMLTHVFPIPAAATLIVVLLALAAGVTASILLPGEPVLLKSTHLMTGIEAWVEVSLKQVKRLFVLLIGMTVLLVGIILIFIPGPAFLVIPAGLAILATEFIWARKILVLVKEKIEQYARRKPFGDSDPDRNPPDRG